MSDLLGLAEPRPSTGEYDNVVAAGPDPALAAHAKRGANWFYWIAGLSMVNSIAFLVGANFHFLAGLGVSEIVDAVGDEIIKQGGPTAIKLVAIVFDIIAFGGFALAGYFSNKLISPVFLIGIIIYAIDGVIVLILGDLFMAAFHAFALYQLIRGFIACRELKQYQKMPTPVISPPPPPAFG